VGSATRGVCIPPLPSPPPGVSARRGVGGKGAAQAPAAAEGAGKEKKQSKKRPKEVPSNRPVGRFRVVVEPAGGKRKLRGGWVTGVMQPEAPCGDGVVDAHGLQHVAATQRPVVFAVGGWVLTCFGDVRGGGSQTRGSTRRWAK
jgi:hypothetical protein